MRTLRERPGEAIPSQPDLEVRRGCFACGGDLSVRVGAEGARAICRRCGAWGHALVEQDGRGVLVAQLPVGLA